MGSSSSIVTDNLPEDIKALIDVIEGQKNRIAEHDASIVERESNKMFKGHNIIIDELTARSKPQLRRMLEKFPNSVKHLDTLSEGGNSYAKFIKQLAISKEQIELDMVTRNDTEYDEEMLIDIIGTSSVKEIRAFDERFTKLKSYSLADVFSAHGKKDSILLKFTQRILRLDRDETKNVDKDLASKQAEIIHKSGAARLIGVDEDPIIEIFASSSRLQCACIAESYLENYNMKLERAINMKFKGNCGKLMVLWTQPVPNAILSVIGYFTGKMLVDTSLIGQFLAKYDKDTLASVDEVCLTTHKKPLSEFVNHGILSSNTLNRALKGWIESPSPDKGFEKILQLFLDSKFPDGNIVIPSPANGSEIRLPSSTNLLTPKAVGKGGADDLQTKFKFLLEKQAQEIKLFMIDRKIKIDPNDQFVLSRSSTQQSSQPGGNTPGRQNTSNTSIASFAVQKKNNDEGNGLGNDFPAVQEDDETADILTPLVSPRKQLPKANEKPTVAPEGRKTVFGTNLKSFSNHKSVELKETHSKEVYNYLTKFFEKKDTENEGSFEGYIFWRHVHSLPLKAFGMTEDDIDTIRQYCSWENDEDGRVYYYESLFEFADSVITAIESNTSGETNVSKVIANLTAQQEESSPASSMRKIVQSSAKRDRTPFPLISKQLSTSSGFGSAMASPRFGESFILSEKRKEQAVSKFPKIPFYLREYIMDTLNAFDFDVNGTMCRTELENLVPTLNIPTLTVEEFFSTSQSDDKVNPKDAADIVSKHIHDYFGDGEDHYICLVDKGSGAYFWYNTRDESTQWADNSTYNADPTTLTEEQPEAEPIGIAFDQADSLEQVEAKESPKVEAKESPKAEAKESPRVFLEAQSKSKLDTTVDQKSSSSLLAESKNGEDESQSIQKSKSAVPLKQEDKLTESQSQSGKLQVSKSQPTLTASSKAASPDRPTLTASSKVESSDFNISAE